MGVVGVVVVPPPVAGGSVTGGWVGVVVPELIGTPPVGGLAGHSPGSGSRLGALVVSS
ncbi:MAG: hypothetical protein ACOYXC_20550 [Candidatus Rifleibacteriota bacterium]